MEAPTRKTALLAVSLLCLASISLADFSLRSLTVFINVNRDGSVNVEEQLSILINGTQSRDLYESTRATYSDLATWKNRTQLSEMRHHLTRAAAEITDLRISPQAVLGCNSFLGTCRAAVQINYLVPAGQNGSGLFSVERYKPRTAKYSLNQDALSFEQTKSGDLVLPTGTNITIAIPITSEKIYFSTPPQGLDEADFRYDQTSNLKYYVGTKRIFTWQGDALTKFQFIYEIESPLESEVLDFFQASQKSAAGFFLGPQGMAALLIIATAAVSAYYFNRLKRR